MSDPTFKCRGVDVEIAANGRVYHVSLATSAQEDEAVWLLDGKAFPSLVETLKYIGVPSTPTITG